jgi:hypothetical protein
MSIKIYISYGLPKSASSFVSQICINASRLHAEVYNKKILQLHDLFRGCPNELCAEEACVMRYENATDYTLFLLVRDILEKLEDEKGESLVILKTHLGCTQGTSKLVEDGLVAASATFRHPVDMLLSRMDMSKRNREGTGLDVFIEHYKSVFISQFNTWADQKNIPKFYYDDIVEKPLHVAAVVARQFDLDVDPSDLLGPLLDSREHIWQFNKGALDRRYAEMPLHEIESIESNFEEYINYIKQWKEGHNRLFDDRGIDNDKT